MPIELPNLTELRQRLVDAHKGAFPEDNVARTSDNYKRLTVASLANVQVNANLSQLEQDLLPDKADDAELDRHGFIWGVPRKGATPARKADAGRVVGLIGGAVAIGDLLTSDGGLSFQVNENFTFIADGFKDVDIIGVSTGEQTKLEAGETLRFVVTPALIQQEVELQLDLDEDGQDEESNGDYRVRLLNRIQQPAAGGNRNDFEQFALEEVGIATAFVYPLRAGRGTVDLAALHTGRGTVRPLTTLERADLTAAIDVKRPVTHDYRTLETLTQLEDVELTIAPSDDLSFAFDWDDAVPPVVTGYTPATRVLALDVRPTDMQKGDRIVVKKVAGAGDGAPLTIEQLGPGALEVTLEVDPPSPPVATDIVYSGGPLTALVRDAILAEFDAFGPARGVFAQGDWQDELVPERVLAIALQTDGVTNGTTVTPVATVTPPGSTFPGDTTVTLLIPGEVVVRKQ